MGSIIICNTPNLVASSDIDNFQSINIWEASFDKNTAFAYAKNKNIDLETNVAGYLQDERNVIIDNIIKLINEHINGVNCRSKNAMFVMLYNTVIGGKEIGFSNERIKMVQALAKIYANEINEKYKLGNKVKITEDDKDGFMYIRTFLWYKYILNIATYNNCWSTSSNLCEAWQALMSF